MKTAKEVADEIYTIGFKNGQIEMKSKILKTINQDWSLAGDITMKILKKINSIKLIKPTLGPPPPNYPH